MAPQKVYVMGGIEGIAAPLNQNLVYDPGKDFWSNGTSMLFPRTGCAIANVDDILYVIGGSNGWTVSYSENQQYVPFGYREPNHNLGTPVLNLTLLIVTVLLSIAILTVVLLIFYRKKLARPR
jgi:hypothetical protein